MNLVPAKRVSTLLVRREAFMGPNISPQETAHNVRRVLHIAGALG